MNSEAPTAPRRLQSLGAALARGWHWWTGELAALVPERWRHRLAGRERLLVCRDEQLELELDGQRQRVALAQSGSDAGLAGWRAQLPASTRLLVLLPQAELLRRVISLPAATEPRLASVLAYELDRHTPFAADQAAFGFRIIGRDRSAQRLEVELFVLPGARRDRLLQGLAEAGLQVQWVLPEGTETDTRSRSTLNLLPERAHPQVRRTLRSRPLWGVLILALLIGILLLRREQQLTELQQQVGPREAAAQQARAIRDELEALQAGSRFILQQRQQMPATLILLAELTRRLPDHTWLNRLELQRGELRLQGESADASGLIGELEASPLLEQVSFTSPVTINPRSRKERFSLTARVGTTEEGAP